MPDAAKSTSPRELANCGCRPVATAYLGPLPFPRAFWAALLLAGLTLFTFGHTLGHKFVFWDDNGLLFENPDFNPPAPAALVTFWANPLRGYRDLYVPVSYTVWWVAAHVARAPADRPFFAITTMPNPVVFHALNLTFHTSGAVVVFFLLRRLVRADLAALFGAALFALHPLQADPVCWVSSMYTSLSGLLALSALLLYLRASDAAEERRGEEERRGDVGGGGVGRVGVRKSNRISIADVPHSPLPHTPTSSLLPASFLLATLCYALALLTKPTVILLPAIVGLIEVGLRGRRWRDCKPLLVWLAIGVADALLARHTQGAAEVYVPPLWLRPLVAADALSFYLRKLLLPVGLAPDYGRPPKWVLAHGAVAFTWLLPAAVAVLCWKLRRKAPWLWVGAAVFLAGVMPTLGLTPFDYQFYSTVADRYVYFSMFGAALVLAFGVRRLTAPQTCPGADEAEEGTKEVRRRSLLRPGLIAAECGLLGMALLSRAQTAYWSDTRTLFEHTLDVNPNSLVAHRQLGFFLLIGNNPEDTELAISHYQSSLRLYPEDGGALSNLGLLLSRQHRPGEAAEAFRRAVALRPNEAPMHYNLGNALAAAGKPEEALAAYAQAMRLSPALFAADLRRSAELAAAGNVEGARLHYRAALTARPGWPEAAAGLERLNASLPTPGPANAGVNPRE